MSFKALVLGIVHLIEKSFVVLEILNNNANYTIIVIGVLIMLIWLRAQVQYSNKARKDGTLI